MKRIHAVLVAITAIIMASALTVSATAISIPSRPESRFVYDEADVISDETEKYIISKNEKLELKTGGQIVIVAVKTTGEMRIDEYADTIFSQWNIGDSGKMNGLLLLLATEDENYWVTQGRGIEYRLSSSKLKDMLDSFLEPHFASADYDKGVSTIFEQFISAYESMYSFDINAEDSIPGQVQAKAGGPSSAVLTVTLILLAIILLIAGAVFVSRKMNEFEQRRPASGPAPRRNSSYNQPPRRNGQTPVRRTNNRPVQRQGNPQNRNVRNHNGGYNRHR